ncbi:hypothetical protein ACVNPS_04440 [Candidatus Bipolaricaulota sp. J31]
MRNHRSMKLVVGTVIALALVLPGLAQPMGPGMVPARQVPERVPELVKAIAAELEALWDRVQDIPALKEALGKPMALAKDALEALKEVEVPSEEALKELVLLSLSLHRIEDVFGQWVRQQVRLHLHQRLGPGRAGGPEGRGPMVGPGRYGEVRDWIEAYLKGAMSALTPEEAAKFRGIIGGLIQGLREEEFAPERGPGAEPPVPEDLEPGKHIGAHLDRLEALNAKLDLFLIRALKALEVPPAE